MNITSAMKTILDGQVLNREQASQVMDQIMAGQATSAQIAGFLVALKQRGERAAEIAGFVDSVRRHAVRVAVADQTAVDGCGTGGDGSHSFNISTAAALVAAAAGATVAKHGNRSVSSSCGSADLLEATGGAIDPGPDAVTKCIETIGFGFLFAPRFHPAFRHAGPARKELGVPTAFNVLGPLTNPAGIRRQLMGVYEARLLDLIAEVHLLTGTDHALIVHSHDGLDELSISAPTSVREIKAGRVDQYIIRPEDVGLQATSLPNSLRGGDPRHNAAMLAELLSGTDGPCRHATLFNAGALLYVAARCADIRAGVALARTAIDSGAAAAKLAAWVELSNGAAS